MSESEKTLEELVEQRTARLRAEVDRAREEGRRAGLEEAALAIHVALADETCAIPSVCGCGIHDAWRVVVHRIDQPHERVEAFEVPGAGVTGLLHSVVPLGSAASDTLRTHVNRCKEQRGALEGAHKLGTNFADEALETVRDALCDLADAAADWGVEAGERPKSDGLAAISAVKRTLADMRREVEALKASGPNAKAAGWLEPWGAAELRTRAERAEADNAALLVFVTGDADVECEEGSTNCGECGPCLARKIKANPHPGTELLERMRTLEQESVPKARVLEVLDAVEREPTQVAEFTADEQEACDTGWNGAVKSVRESLGLDDEETRR